MFEVIIPTSVKKDLKKMDRPIIDSVITLLEGLARNPYKGISLTGEFYDLLKLEFRQQGIHYRIAYRIVKDKIQVQVIHIGTRENFYSELKNAGSEHVCTPK